MKRKHRPWTKDELDLLGKLPDAEVAELTGRTFGTVWQKPRALGIDQPELRFRKWTTTEDKLVGIAPNAEIAHQIDRTERVVQAAAPFSSVSAVAFQPKSVRPCLVTVTTEMGARQLGELIKEVQNGNEVLPTESSSGQNHEERLTLGTTETPRHGDFFTEGNEESEEIAEGWKGER